MTAILESALSLASHHWRVHPVWGIKDGACTCPLGAACDPKNQGKHPILGGWQEKASAEEEAVRRWWNIHPDANLGIATGRESGFFVFDVDGANGRASLAMLEEKHGPLPETLMARSGRGDGGVHYYFEFPAIEIRNKQMFLPGIDIRGQGGFVIGPPSIHRSGSSYSWINESTPIAPAPGWLIAALAPKQHEPVPARPMAHTDQTKRAGAYLAKMPPSISGSGGHDAAFRAAVILVKGFSLSTEEALSLLLSEFNQRCQPPWTEKELRHKVSGAELGTLPDGFIANRPSKLRVVKSSGWDELNPPPIEEAPPEHSPKKITADEFERMLDDDIGAALRPDVFARLMAVRDDKALWLRIEEALRRKRIKKAFLEEMKRHDKQQQRSAIINEEWKKDLSYRENKNGDLVLENCHSNLVQILTHDAAWVGVLVFDEFSRQLLCRRPPPFEREPGRWTDEDTAEVLYWIEKNYPLRPAITKLHDVIRMVAHRGVFNSQVEYLDALKHDRVPRLDRMLADRFGCEATRYNMAVSSKWMISAVARAYEPGCKVDTVLVLEGEQGQKKSRFFKQLCPQPSWFVDGLSDIGSRAQAEEIEGKWIVELGEMRGLNRDIEQTKAFVTREAENYRPAYGREVIHRPRRCVFAGTTNKGEHLDETGNRRFWSVACEHAAPELTPEIRDQLWAEARDRYRAGELYYLNDEELILAAKIEQKKRLRRDAWHELIEDGLVGVDETSVPEILKSIIRVPTDKWDGRMQQRIGYVMASLDGWEKCQRTVGGRRQWRFRRVEPQQGGLPLAF